MVETESHVQKEQTAPFAEENKKTEQDLKPKPKKRSKVIWLIPLAALIAGISYYASLPPVAELVHPTLMKITESIAATGSVKGRKESTVGAQMSGTVEAIYAREGAIVKRGQVIAKISSAASQAAAAQAEQAVQTAQAALAQAQMRPLASDLQSAQSKILQLQEAKSETETKAIRMHSSVESASAAVSVAQGQVRAAEAGVANAQAQLDLATKNFQRSSFLLQEGAIPEQEFDTARTARDGSQASLDLARATLEGANASLLAAKHNLTAAQLDYQAAQKEIPQAAALVASAKETYNSLNSQPLKQNVDLAKQRLKDAEAALATARTQAQYAQVTAPFDGIVTSVIAEAGTQAGPAGIIKLAEMEVPQISVDLDESDMADLRTQEKAILSPVWNGQLRLEGRVIRIGPEVDYSRGTVNVLIAPSKAASWLMPGQTVNVNLIKRENVERVVVPLSAVRHEGNSEIVLAVAKGATVGIPVSTGPSVGNVIPVLNGLGANDLIVKKAETLAVNAKVRVRQ